MRLGAYSVLIIKRVYNQDTFKHPNGYSIVDGLNMLLKNTLQNYLYLLK